MPNKKRRNNKAVFRKFASTAALGTMLISPMAPAMNVVADALEGDAKHSLVQPTAEASNVFSRPDSPPQIWLTNEMLMANGEGDYGWGSFPDGASFSGNEHFSGTHQFRFQENGDGKATITPNEAQLSEDELVDLIMERAGLKAQYANPSRDNSDITQEDRVPNWSATTNNDSARIQDEDIKIVITGGSVEEGNVTLSMVRADGTILVDATNHFFREGQEDWADPAKIAFAQATINVPVSVEIPEAGEGVTVIDEAYQVTKAFGDTSVTIDERGFSLEDSTIVSVQKDGRNVSNEGITISDGNVLNFTNQLDAGTYTIIADGTGGDGNMYRATIILTITPRALTADDLNAISEAATIARAFNDTTDITEEDIESRTATVTLNDELGSVKLDLTPLVKAGIVSFDSSAVGERTVTVDFTKITDAEVISTLVDEMFEGTNFTLDKTQLGESNGEVGALVAWLNENADNFFTGEIVPNELSADILNEAFNAGTITRTIDGDDISFAIGDKPVLDFTDIPGYKSLGKVELDFAALEAYTEAFTFEHDNAGSVGVAFDVTEFKNTESLKALLGDKAETVMSVFSAEGSGATLEAWIGEMAGSGVEDEVFTAGQFFTATNQVNFEVNDQMRIRAHATGGFGSQNNVTTDENGVLQVGTVGQAQALHTFQLELKDANGNLIPGIEIGGHVQVAGNVKVANGQRLGTEGQRLEGINIRVAEGYQLTGDYTIEYRMHVQGQGWLDWADIENHEFAGTEGYGIRGEAIQVRVVSTATQEEAEENGEQIAAADIVSLDAAEGAVEPETNNTLDVNVDGIHHIHPTVKVGTGHVQVLGNLHDEGEFVSTTGAGIKTIGTTEQGRRLEELTLGIKNAGLHGTDGLVDAGELQIAAHLQDIGWTKGETNEDGTVTVGTRGQARRLEALSIELPEAMQQVFSIQYRVHVQGQGWLAWTADGGLAGTTGQARRIEAVQVRIVPRGAGLGLPAGGSANAGVMFTGDFADLNTVQEIQNPPATEPETEVEDED